MKRILLPFLSIAFSCILTNAQNIGINATGANPDSSAMLDVSSSNKGFLAPRVALTGTGDISTITNPATSLLVYNTATAGISPNNVVPGFYFWNGAVWSPISSGSGWGLSGNAGISNSNFIGSSNNASLRFRTNDTERMILDSLGSVGIGTSKPAYKLTLGGTGDLIGIDNTAIFVAKNSAGIYERYLFPRWSDNVMYLNYGANGFNIRNNSNVSAIFMTNARNVGIGTTTPGYKLTIGGTSAVLGTDNSAFFVAKNAAGVYEPYLFPRWSDNVMYLNYGANGFNIRNNTNISTMFITNAGNVGIGTTNPGYKLTIAGLGNVLGVDNQALLSAKNAAGVYEPYLFPRWSDNVMYLNYGSGGFNIRNNANVSAMVMTNAGNVGIGTTSPNAPLQFANTVANRKIVVYEQANNDHQYYGFGMNGSMLRYQVGGNFASHAFFSGASPSSSIELFRITGTGNVGIGTIAPNAPLQFANTVANRKIVLYEVANNDHQYFGLGVNGGVLRYQVNQVFDSHIFYAGTGANSSKELMRITGSGTVGIGTSVANAPLQFANTAVNRKIVLYEVANNDHQYFGFGINGFMLRYQVNSSSDNHAFFAGASASTSTELMRITGTGNVGIGTASPGYKLTIRGTGNVFGVDNQAIFAAKNTAGVYENYLFPRWVDNVMYLKYAANGFNILNNSDVSTMYMTNAGNVGIGTSAPTQKLTLSGTGNVFGVDNTAVFVAKNTTGTYEPYLWPRYNDDVMYLNYGDGGFNIRNNESVTSMSISSNGSVGITNSASIEGILYVNGGINKTLFSTGVFLAGGYVFRTSTPALIGLDVENSVEANAFYAVSDCRIKKDISQSDSKNDLELLSKIQIKNYKHIDTIAQSNVVIKKVIAQELKQILPQAITIKRGIVPDIYQKAEMVNGFIELKNSLKAGDTIKIIGESFEKLVPILEANGNGFKTNLTSTEKVFVYGKQVDDFHSVDYDALSTLNISATQELLKRIESLEKENGNLKTQISNLNNLKSEVESLKSMIINSAKAELRTENK